MTFADRLIRAPRPYDPDRANTVSDHLLVSQSLNEFLRGVAGCSPYLGGLLVREADWLLTALDDPEAAFDGLIDGLGAFPMPDIAQDLRQAKRRGALLIGLADLGGVWSLEQVTRALSRLADAATQAAMRAVVAAEVKRGKLPGVSGEVGPDCAGMIAISMGKGGAFELNYSSDIDLIMLFDETRFDPADFAEARSSFVRATRKMTALLSDTTSGGYVFRTDLRLRPDASVTPVCISTEAAERYYESVGRTWERAAYIKARAAAGAIEAGERFLKTLTPFVWRKHLDFAAIEDAHDMRLRIRDHKGLGGALNLDGHNVKLGRGGIREIEFFTQTRQLIAGGRDPSLRVRDTKTGLDRLTAAGWVPDDVNRRLYDHYSFHREVEHRLQMIADQQTHSLPANGENWDRLAAFMDRDVGDLKREMTDRFEEVHSLTEGFFAPDAAGTAPTTASFGADYEEVWFSYPAFRSDRAVELFKRLKPGIFDHLQQAAQPEEALRNFDGFLRGLPAGVQLFSLFNANPQLLQLIVDICATAPALSQYLSRNASVLDMVIGGDFFAPWPDVGDLTDGLTRVMSGSDDYETQLNLTRRWMKEWHFRIGVHHLRGLIDADQAGRQYADLAEAVIRGMWPAVVQEFARKHGSMPGNGAVVLGMGSLGAGRLHAGSDLDLIMIYDDDGVDASDGPRPLQTRAYYARLTQALVTAVTAPMADGRLYEVDMRLRPSGRQGPIATSVASFDSYQRTEAWTWEHLALTRARAIAGSETLGQKVEAIRRAVLTDKAAGPNIRGDVADMRDRIASAKTGHGAWEAKIGAGRLQDVELSVQTATLLAGSDARTTADQIAAGVAAGLFDAADGAALTASADLYWRLQMSAKLLTGDKVDPQALGEGGRRFILRETGHDTFDALGQTMAQTAAAANAAIERLLDRDQTDDDGQD